jgi:DNA modification methylase
VSVIAETSPATLAQSCQVLIGDALTRFRELPSERVHCVVTSPPYWGLRDYGTTDIDFAAGSYSPMSGLPMIAYPAWRGQLGLEPDPLMFIGHMVEIFREAHRVLRNDGTCWVNMGDCYAGAGLGGKLPTLKVKDMIAQPWRLALALQADGWYLRQDIIWHKPNPMPESVRDRCTKAHEYIFLLTKSPRYFFDLEANKEPVSGTAHARGHGVNPKAAFNAPTGWDTSAGEGGHGSIHRDGRRPKSFGKNSRVRVDRDPAHESGAQIRAKQNRSFSAAVSGLVDFRNKRDVWTVAPKAYRGAHYATFPPKLIEPCILAGCPVGGTVLDPFGGSGTTAEVALRHGRSAILFDLNPLNQALIDQRLAEVRA